MENCPIKHKTINCLNGLNFGHKMKDWGKRLNDRKRQRREGF